MPCAIDSDKDEPMLTHAATLPLLAAGVSLALLTGAPAFGQNPKLHLAATIDRIEQELDARVGVVIRESGSDWIVSHRAEERFLMASTFKTMLCGAVLHRVDEGDLDLEERIAIEAAEVLEYAPVTEKMVGETMSVGELCHAALDMSDNTATNLLIDRIEGPQSVTAFLREIGDPVSRLDRREPDVNTFAPDDPRDTTTPEAMVSTMETLLTGDALSPQSRALLVDWMSDGGVTGALIRASTPAGWHVADRSGSGNFNRNIVAMVTPPDREPYFIAIFLSDADADFNTRNGAVIELSKAVMQVVTSR
ncbi:class A beta-lactamase [Roseovarius mucosus]|nr:class A beta-lactamase [Roseovarius mucosus]